MFKSTVDILQIWSDIPTVGDEGYGEVEIVCVNYSTIYFKHPKDGHSEPITKKDFLNWFTFVRTIN